MFVWDGIVSCLRQWSEKEWREQFDRSDFQSGEVSIKSTLFCQRIVWLGEGRADNIQNESAQATSG